MVFHNTVVNWNALHDASTTSVCPLQREALIHAQGLQSTVIFVSAGLINFEKLPNSENLFLLKRFSRDYDSTKKRSLFVQSLFLCKSKWDFFLYYYVFSLSLRDVMRAKPPLASFLAFPCTFSNGRSFRYDIDMSVFRSSLTMNARFLKN